MGEIWNGKIWHNESVPHFAAVFNNGSNGFNNASRSHQSWCMRVLVPQSENFVPNFAAVFKNCCHIVSAPNVARS